MLTFINRMFFIAITLFSCNTLKSVSLSNQECKTRPKIININSNESLFYPYGILVNNCSVINNSYAK